MNRLSKKISMVITLVHETHNSQFDKGGKPYVLHPLTVAVLKLLPRRMNKDLPSIKVL